VRFDFGSGVKMGETQRTRQSLIQRTFWKEHGILVANYQAVDPYTNGLNTITSQLSFMYFLPESEENPSSS
jgi:hypothetical protein